MQDVKFTYVALGEPEDPFYELFINGVHYTYCTCIEAVGVRIEDYKALVQGKLMETT